MTLTEYQEKWPHLITFKGDIAHTPDKTDFADRWQLWCLSDYRVTSVIGGTVWLSKFEFAN